MLPGSDPSPSDPMNACVMRAGLRKMEADSLFHQLSISSSNYLRTTHSYYGESAPFSKHRSFGRGMFGGIVSGSRSKRLRLHLSVSIHGKVT